jgi:hypothetical protein
MASKRFLVVDGPLSVRKEPNGMWVSQLTNGQEIEVDADSRRETGGFVWWKHNLGWSAEKSSDGSKVLMTEVAAKPASTTSKKLFTVAEPLSVRAEPGLNGKWLTQLTAGLTLEAEPDSRREMDSFVWWKHNYGGWSAEKALNGPKVYLKEATTAASATSTSAASSGAASAQPEQKTPTITVSISKKKSWRVGNQEVRVRREPGLRGAEVKWVAVGTLLECDESSCREVDGYVWWQHSEGWTAERSVDGISIFLVDPSTPIATTPTTFASGLPDPKSLPMLNSVFQRLPVDLDKTLWWQYYGNNNFAYNLWAKGTFWYKYAQGLHGGVDFGNSNHQGILMYAGVTGTFQQLDRQYTPPSGQWVTVGDYTIIYGHCQNPRPFKPGDVITPDTIMGELQFGGQNHLHLEVRYKSRWLVNPLLLMPEAMRNSLLAKFPQGSKYFYSDATWKKWQTWDDQPVLILGGPLIGPHAR